MRKCTAINGEILPGLGFNQPYVVSGGSARASHTREGPARGGLARGSSGGHSMSPDS